MRKRFPPLVPSFPKPPIKTACITGSLFYGWRKLRDVPALEKNSATSAAGRRKDALKRLDGSINTIVCFPGQARKFANTIPLDVDGDTATLQYFRFEPLHSQGNPIPIHAQVRWQTQSQEQKFFGREGRENLFPKGFPPASFSLFTSSGVTCRPQNKKIPGGAGQKNSPR